MRFQAILLAGLTTGLLVPVSRGQTVNVKILHNTQHTDVTSRASNASDTLYYMQPALTRTGYGRASGWRGVLQDFDYRTSETVQFAFVPYATNSDRPDVNATAVIGNTSATLNFPQPSTGTSSAVLWTLTVQTPVDVPQQHGLRAVLPAVTSQTDGVYIHTQRGRTSQVPVALRKQYSWFLNNGQATGLWEAGTTLWLGGIYEQPVTQMFVNSNRYGTREDLLGLEALFPSAGAGDTVGFQLTGAQFPSQVGVLLISGGLAQRPVVTGLGTLFMLPPFGLIQLPFALDSGGLAKSPTVAVPSGVKIWAQTAFVNLTNGNVRISDATGIEAQ